MRRHKLDRIDRKILNDLQNNGRMTNVELATRAGISAPPCLRRVRKLEESGFIKSYHANLDATALGYSVTVFAHVKLGSQSEGDLRKFEDAVGAMPEVRECHMLTGETDYLLKIVARNWDAYQAFLTQTLTSAPSVASVRSSLRIRVTKETPGVPIDVNER
jgi:DNA-binding Lrp family transcriptional regulator